MSPIHDQSYRRYGGQRSPLGRGWLVILRAGLRGLIARKVFIGLLLGAWVPFIVRTVQIYFVTMAPQVGTVVPVDVRMFQSFVETQGLFVFFISVYAGSGLIANDRRANALQVYLSKPLLRMEYIGGKLGVLMTYLLGVTLVPGLLLIMMQIVISGSFRWIGDNAYVIPAVILASLLRVTVSAFAILALSSLSKSARYVSILYTGVIFFTESMYGVLRLVTGSTRVAWVSIGANLDVVSDAIFRSTARYETPVLVSLVVIAGVLAVSVSVLERRVRGVEVVA